MLVGELDPQRALVRPPVARRHRRRQARALTASCGTRRRRGTAATCRRRWLIASRSRGWTLADPGMMRNLLYTLITTRDDVAGCCCGCSGTSPTSRRGWPGSVTTTRCGSRWPTASCPETLRLEQSEFVMRRAYTDIRFGEVLIPEGWFVRVCIHEIHRDPATIGHTAHVRPRSVPARRRPPRVRAFRHRPPLLSR